MQNLSWTAYQNMTKAQTMKLFRLVNRLVEEKKIGMSYSVSYKRMLAELKTDFPQDAQDFIEYCNL